MKRVLLILIAVVLSVCEVALAQTQTPFVRIETEFLAIARLYLDQPNRVELSNVESLIKEIDTYTQAGKLKPIEKFTLPYYDGYLRYMAGLLHDQTSRRTNQLQAARAAFETAYRQYDANLGLAEKSAVAKYMQAWCHLHEFLSPSNPDDTTHLDQAIQILDRLAGKSETNFMQFDIAFLKGLAHYLIAYEDFKSMRANRNELDKAIVSFIGVNGGTEELQNLGQMYLAAAYYLRSQYAVLNAAQDTSDSRTDLEKARQIFDEVLADAAGLELPVRFGFDMTNLQRAAPNQPLDILVRDYVDLLGRTGITDPAESQFWQDVMAYLSYLQDTRNELLPRDGLFEQIQTNDWRTPYLQALANFYRKEFLILSNGFFEAAAINIDSNLLAPELQDRNHYLDVYLRYRTDWSATNPRDSFSRLSNAFQNRDADIFSFARYFLTLARKNSALYAVAFSSYSYLETQGYDYGKVMLLKAYCKYHLGNYNDVLSMLGKETVREFGENNRSEAYYYRAMVYRKIDGLEYSKRVIEELRNIQDQHPYAGYGIAYEQYGHVGDRTLFNNVCTQACSDSRFKNLCEACDRQEFEKVDKLSPILVGDDDVRFEYLENELLNQFVQKEARSLVTFWRVLSCPLLRPLPGRAGNDEPCLVSGPLEFYLANRMDIQLVMGHSKQTKEVLIASRDGCRKFSTTAGDTVLSILALRPYHVVVAIQGYFPAIWDTSFSYNKETLTAHFDKAFQVESVNNEKRGDFEGMGVTLDTAGPFFLASSENAHYVGIYQNGKKRISQPYETYNAIAPSGDEFFVLDRSFDRIEKIAKDGHLSELQEINLALLKDASDLTVVNGHLYVVNAGDNSIVGFDLSSGDTSTYRSGRFGQLESIAAIENDIFVSDWKNNTVFKGQVELTQFKEFASVSKARQDGMLAPAKISTYKKFLLVSDLIAGKIFMFHKGGEYLGALDVGTVGIYGPRAVFFENNGAIPKMSICHAHGVHRLELIQNSTYVFKPLCDKFRQQSDTSSESGVSRFCKYSF